MKRLLVAVVIAIAGCGAGGDLNEDGLLDEQVVSSDEGLDAVDESEKADVVQPVGTYEGEPRRSLERRLVLMTDRTFHLEQLCPPNARCREPRLSWNGTYRFQRSGQIRYLALYTEAGEVLYRYAYRLNGDRLELRRTNTTIWFALSKAVPAWCAEVQDCTVQRLPVPRCIGRFTCVSNACGFRCGID